MTTTRSQEPSIFDNLPEPFDFEQRLAVIQAIRSCVPEVDENDDDYKQIGELIVANSTMDILNRELTYLAADMGVDVDEKKSQLERLQELMVAVDGNRRQAKLR